MKHRSVLVYVVAGSALVALYGAADWFGWETGTAAREQIAPNVRQSPGGWRAWTFWHSGPHGGK